MAAGVFNARFTPTDSGSLTANTFQVTADIFDGSGTFSGLDVSLQDVVFLDTFNSITAPNTVSRYTVQSIVSKTVTSVVIILKYADTGSPVDPAEILGNPGFIASSSVNKSLVYHAAPTIHTFPDYVTQFARDYDNYILLEDALTSSGSTAITESFLNNSGLSISALTLVRQDTSSNIAKINPSLEADVLNILGLLVQTTPSGSSGLVALSGLIKNVTTSFAVGDVIYLSKGSGLTTTVPEIGSGGFVAGDFVVKIGRIIKNLETLSAKDFKLEVEIKGQL